LSLTSSGIAITASGTCLPSWEINHVPIDPPPWSVVDHKGNDRFKCPGCGKAVAWRIHGPAGLGEVHRVQAAGNDEPIPFNRVGAAGRVGFDRAQVAEGLPSLRLAAGRIIKLAHDANRRLLDRANLWQASSASSALRSSA
jgi:predicted RNA-binding Zn-ribbon protein involved in translation (DUF1610 family)